MKVLMMRGRIMEAKQMSKARLEYQCPWLMSHEVATANRMPVVPVRRFWRG